MNKLNLDALSDLESATVNTSLEIISQTDDIGNLGKYQLDLLSRVYVKTFANLKTEKVKDGKVGSSVIYNYFLTWLTENSTHEQIIKYFSCPIFVKYFSELYDNKRLASGKTWVDIQLKELELNSEIESVQFSGGALMSLVAYGLQNVPFKGSIVVDDLFKKHHKKSYSLNRFKPHNGALYVRYDSQPCDLYRPFKLIIEGDMSDLHKLTDLSVQNTDFTWTFNYFSLMLHTCMIEQTDTSVTLDLREMPYFQGYSTIKYILINYSEPINISIGLISEGVYLDSEPRRELYKTPKHYQLIRSYYEFSPLEEQERSSQLSFLLSLTGGLSKGLFIRCNVNDLIRVQIMLNGHDLLHYDEPLVHHMCERIDDQMMYVPFDKEYSWKDRARESYQTGTNICRIENFRVFLNFKSDQESACIYTDGFNYLECTSQSTDTTASLKTPMSKYNYSLSWKLHGEDDFS